jgi:hypothetical protein
VIGYAKATGTRLNLAGSDAFDKEDFARLLDAIDLQLVSQ